MSDDGIPPEVQSFLADNIQSVVQLEALLLLHGKPAESFTPADVAREMRIDPAWAEPNLSSLCARHVLTREQTNPPRYRYQPQSEELRHTIDMLADCYAKRRVSVISRIFAKPPSPLQHFADAFRLRKEKGDG